MLELTTSRRFALLVFVFLMWTPAAYAWSRPVQGPVLRPFSYDEAHPYVAGQHRGVDFGAAALGETVVAPAAGTVSFAGTVPTNGESVTIETADGYSVTLTHLGAISVSKGATVAEQDAIGTVGSSGTPEVDAPYVHLGIRVTADPNGYVDPLMLLPPASAGNPGPPQTTSTGSGAAPAKKPASSAPRSPRVATASRGSSPQADSRVRVREDQPRGESDLDAHTTQAGNRPVVRRGESAGPRAQPGRVDERTSSIRRPLVEPSDLGVAHELPSRTPSTEPRHEPSRPLLGLVCNGAAALCALGAALAAGRRRRRRRLASAPSTVLCLPPPAGVDRQMSRAA